METAFAVGLSTMVLQLIICVLCFLKKTQVSKKRTPSSA
jgi:hypothetical protein